MLEQIAHDDAAGDLIDIDPDELRPLVGGAHRPFGELAADMVGLLVVAVGERLPDLLLARVIVGDRERHQLLERHAIFGVDVEQFLRDGGEFEPLLDDGRADKEPRGENWSSGCSAARWTFSASESSSARPSVRTTQGTGWVLFIRFCLTRSSRAR